MDFTKLGGRRFLLAVGAGVVASLLQWYGKLGHEGTQYAVVISATVAAYITGNVVERNSK